jgi:hypothetical protein
VRHDRLDVCLCARVRDGRARAIKQNTRAVVPWVALALNAAALIECAVLIGWNVRR